MQKLMLHGVSCFHQAENGTDLVCELVGRGRYLDEFC